MTIDVSSELEKILVHRPDPNAPASVAEIWANEVVAAIAVEAKLQTAGRVPAQQRTVPSLGRGSNAIALLALAAAKGLTLEAIETYLIGDSRDNPPVDGDAGSVLRELYAGITTDVLNLAGRRGDNTLRTTAKRPLVSTSMSAPNSSKSMRSLLVASVIEQVKARVTFDRVLPLRQASRANAPFEPVRLLATAVVEEEVTLEKLAEALGAGQLPYIDQLLAAQAGAEVR